MSFDIVQIILALLGLSFLVFIHELGHYVVAKRTGMKVEVFSIGFGKPLYTWTYQGVKWQVCYLLFGGYVKIAGMEKEGKIEPHLIKDGFYGKSPWARMKVVLMGPIVNIVFAFILFTAIWAAGGREKPFREFTNVIGWIDPASELVQKGVRPGDTITEYGGKKFSGFNDLLYGGVLNTQSIEIHGDRINYLTGQKVPYEYQLQGYPMAGYPKGIKTLGISPANYILFYGFDPQVGKQSPAFGSGIEKGDRVVWANGEVVFSAAELSHVVNRNDAYLTIDRKGKTLHLRIPRVALEDLQLNAAQKDEFLDWKHALGISEPLDFIPYEVDALGAVRGKLSYIDDETLAPKLLVAGLDEPLQLGDHILAVNGKEVSNGLEIFSELRTNKVLIIVDRKGIAKDLSLQEASRDFTHGIHFGDLQQLTESIGTANELQRKGDLVLLHPIAPVTESEFYATEKYESQVVRGLQTGKRGVEYLFLGAMIGDQPVVHNPTPMAVCEGIVIDTGRTLGSLVTGNLSPKWLSGPVGIVKMMHYGVSVGWKEAFYWMGFVSLSLGIFNLLPIPGLDGGHFCFSLWESVTRRPISSRVREKLLFPFIFLVVGFFLYVTYQDISRFFQ